MGRISIRAIFIEIPPEWLNYFSTSSIYACIHTFIRIVSIWFHSIRFDSIRSQRIYWLIFDCVYIKKQSETKSVGTTIARCATIYHSSLRRREKKSTKLAINLRDSRSKYILATPIPHERKTFLHWLIESDTSIITRSVFLSLFVVLPLLLPES